MTLTKKQPYWGLKKQIAIKGLKQADVANEIGMDITTFNLKLNRSNGRDFYFSEVSKIARYLKIHPSDFF
ncbi:MAG TPA: helix-turn-helix transcriptional regulator [Ligilactobacillus acidipiscis]|mgnify:CR=1 FL=1|uniref:Helix-turn-helix transcriptional regulator n=1 Tax=Ligilactobacillus acidipiscis TaxID=89059 RepID=A0A921F723_9LACO|nr:helix-turn-helix transcriptional regulator [Ligilactobacillus acidipiscis]